MAPKSSSVHSVCPGQQCLLMSAVFILLLLPLHRWSAITRKKLSRTLNTCGKRPLQEQNRCGAIRCWGRICPICSTKTWDQTIVTFLGKGYSDVVSAKLLNPKGTYRHEATVVWFLWMCREWTASDWHLSPAFCLWLVVFPRAQWFVSKCNRRYWMGPYHFTNGLLSGFFEGVGLWMCVWVGVCFCFVLFFLNKFDKSYFWEIRTR